MGRVRIRVLGVALFLATTAIAGTNQNTRVVQERAALQMSHFMSEIRSEMGLSSDSTFSKAQTQYVGDNFCSRSQQLLKNQAIIGTFVLACFSEDGKAVDKDAAVCGGECLERQTQASYTLDELKSLAATQLANTFARDFEKFNMTKSPFVTVLTSSATSIWIQDPTTEGLKSGAMVLFTTAESPGSFVAYMDASTGNLVMYEYRIWTAEGRANVYTRDRKTTSELKNVVLKDLVNVEKLASPYYSIKNEDSANASSSEGNYVFSPDDTHFAEAQVYYGLQFALDRLRADYKYVPFGSIPVVVHHEKNYNNAFYDGDRIAIGDGDGKVLLDLAKDNTVVTHEYGHAIIDHMAHVKMAPPMFGDLFGQGGAIHEGHADYFGCSVYDQASIGDGVMPDGKPMRRCDLNNPFSERNGEVHAAGQVWSGALWEVRQAVGAKDVDLMSVDALMRLKSTGLSGTTKMMDMYEAVLASDQALNSGRNLQKIQEIFAKRGFKAPKRAKDRNKKHRFDLFPVDGSSVVAMAR
jgi:zinc metalloprotease ZmpB